MAIQWSLVFFAALAAWGAGTYLVSMVMSDWFGLAKRTRKPALILSAVSLILGAVASMTHLGHLERIFGVLSNPTSGIFVEGLSAGLLVVVIAVYLVAMERAAKPVTLKVIGAVGIMCALVLMMAVGTSYLMVSKPAWDVLTLPVLSVTAALEMGCLTVFFLNSFVESELEKQTKAVLALQKGTFVVVIVQAAALIAYVISVGIAPFPDETRSAARIIGGDLAPLFWCAVVLLGIALPLIVSLFHGRPSKGEVSGGDIAIPSNSVLLGVALVGAIAAVVAFRVIMFSVGTSIISFGF